MRQKARNTISSYMVGVMGIPCGMPCRELQQLFPPKKQGNSAAAVNPKQIPLLWFYPQKSSCLSEGSLLCYQSPLYNSKIDLPQKITIYLMMMEKSNMIWFDIHCDYDKHSEKTIYIYFFSPKFLTLRLQMSFEKDFAFLCVLLRHICSTQSFLRVLAYIISNS